MKKKLCGENYYPITELLGFVDRCTENNIAVLSVDFYIIEGESVCPYDKLQGFDGTGLYRGDLSHENNVLECNRFIKQTFLRSNIQNENLYYSVVLEDI